MRQYDSTKKESASFKKLYDEYQHLSKNALLILNQNYVNAISFDIYKNLQNSKGFDHPKNIEVLKELFDLAI